MALPVLFRFFYIWNIQDVHDLGHKELIAQQRCWGSWETAQHKKAHDLNQIRDSQKATTFNGWVGQIKVFILGTPMSLKRWNGSCSGEIFKYVLCTLWECIHCIAPSSTGGPNTQRILDMHFAATTVMWVDLSFSSVLPIFHFPLLSLLLSLLLLIIPFPTYLGSLCSLRGHPAKHTFPPAMAAQHIIALGTLAPLLRGSGNKPRHYQLLCDPRAPQGGTEAPSGVRRMVLRQHPVSSAHPTKHYTLLACVRVCSSDL